MLGSPKKASSSTYDVQHGVGYPELGLLWMIHDEDVLGMVPWLDKIMQHINRPCVQLHDDGHSWMLSSGLACTHVSRGPAKSGSRGELTRYNLH